MHYFIMQVGNVSLPEATKKAVEDIRKKVKMPKKYKDVQDVRSEALLKEVIAKRHYW